MKMLKVIALVLSAGTGTLLNAQTINLGSDNYIMLHTPGDVNWRFGKDGNHNINIYGAGYGDRKFRIIDTPNGTELFNVNLLSGYAGLGVVNPTAKLDVYQNAGETGQNSGIRIRAGNSQNYFGNTQLVFSYNGGSGYSHAIKTRHSSTSVAGNAFDFYVWKPGDAVEAEGSNFVMTLNGSNVGIGTASPGVKLDIVGAGSSNTDLRVNGRIQTGDASNFGGIWVSATSGMFVGQNSSTSMGLYNNGEWRLLADNTGKIAIGTTDVPGNHKLYVNGSILTTEVNVKLKTSWPDYVFENDYKLPSLSDLEQFIKTNKHLPEVPSAIDVKENGLSVGEMNAILLKKVEELTLHLIELKHENERQSRLNEQQQEEIEKLKKK